MAALLQGMVAKTDFAPRYCREASKHTSYCYNQFPGQLVGNYENWVYAHPDKDWCLATCKCTIDLLEGKIQAGLATVVWADLPFIWGEGGGGTYNWFRLGLKESRWKFLEASHLAKDEPPASDRD